MKFRLTYEGPLRATQNDPLKGQPDPRANHKHLLRKQFHIQLKELWRATPFLQPDHRGRNQIWNRRAVETGERNVPHSPDSLATRHVQYGFNFVPLVTDDMELYCGLDILFLRRDRPGKIWYGDIDNRIKTLIDALKIPSSNENYDKRDPDDDEKPFYCLLEEDKLVTRLSVESDQLLQPVPNSDGSGVRLLITVHIWPYAMHMGNLEFGGGG